MKKKGGNPKPDVMIPLVGATYFFFFITLSLELSDTKVYEP